MAYGDRGAGDVIPPDATLLFDIVVMDVEQVPRYVILVILVIYLDRVLVLEIRVKYGHTCSTTRFLGSIIKSDPKKHPEVWSLISLKLKFFHHIRDVITKKFTISAKKIWKLTA